MIDISVLRILTYFALINTNNSQKYYMSEIFINKQLNFNNNLFSTNYIIEKNTKIQSNFERDEYKNMIYYPSSSKE